MNTKKELSHEVMEALHNILYAWELMYYPRKGASQKTDLNDFSPIELHIIKIIANSSGLIDLQEIREITKLHNSTLTSLIKRLHKSKVISKSRSIEDRRKQVIQLTDLGYQINHDHYKLDIDIAKNFISRISEAEAKVFVSIVEKATKTSLVPKVRHLSQTLIL